MKAIFHWAREFQRQLTARGVATERLDHAKTVRVMVREAGLLKDSGLYVSVHLALQPTGCIRVTIGRGTADLPSIDAMVGALQKYAATKEESARKNKRAWGKLAQQLA